MHMLHSSRHSIINQKLYFHLSQFHLHLINRHVQVPKPAYIVISSTGSSEMDSAESSEFSTSSLTVVYRDFPG